MVLKGETQQSSEMAALSWGRFAPILAIHFLGTLGFSLALPFLVYIVADLGGAPWTYGLLGATYSLFQLVGAPLLGRWSDRVGRRPVLVASQVGTLAAWILFLVALSLPVDGDVKVAGATLTLPLVMIFVARALDGLTGGNISVANAYVADITRDTPKVRQRAFGRMGMASSVGFVVGPALAGLLGATELGMRLPIAVAALMAGLATIAIIAVLKEPGGRCPGGPPPADMTEAGLNQQAKRCDRPPVARSRKLGMFHGPVAVILVATLLIFLAFNIFYAGFPVHAAEAYGWGGGELGLFFAVLSGAMFLSQGPVLTFASKRLSPRACFASGMVILALGFATYLLPGGPLTFVGAILFAIGNGLSWPTFQARVAEIAGDDQGAVQGLVTGAASLASIGGLIAGGFLYSSLEGGVFVLAAGLFVLLSVLTPRWFAP